MLSFSLLGHVEVIYQGKRLHYVRSLKELAVLIYLAQMGTSQPRDGIADLLWHSSSPKQALSNLRTALARLQPQIGEALQVTSRSLALAPNIQQHVDSLALLQTLATIGPVSPDSITTLQNTLAAYKGDFLANFHLQNAPHFEEWVATTREHIHREVVAGYKRLAEYIASVGECERGIAVTRRWLQIDPLNETAHTTLLQFLLATGDSREALAHYQRSAELLRMELGIEPPAAMTALINNLQPRRAAVPRLVTARHNLPAQHDRFVGREAAQRSIHMRLDQAWCRLVTLVGPGGMGKTRLAAMVARERLRQYPDGVWLVDLADVDATDENAAEAIAVEIAAALDLRFAGTATPEKQVLDYVQHKHVLLILDNFEHVLAGSQIVLEITQRCEHVQLLVTSREALRLRAEWVVALGGLSYPSSASDDTPTEAVELFSARWEQQHAATLAGDELAAVRAICHMVEGLPLAIELAAALTRRDTACSIANSLHNGFDALTASMRDRPQRHKSMQVVFEMSWRTLAPALQQVLACLSVFRGGFTAGAAHEVASADAGHLAALVDKSLLSYRAGSERYALHPVIRAFAAAKHLANDGATERHARFFLALLAAHAAPLQGLSPQGSMALLEPDIENIRFAWQASITQRRADLLIRALPALSSYYQLRGLSREGEATMHATTDAAARWNAGGVALATRASVERARFQNRLGQYWPAMQSAQAVLKLAAACADRWAEGMAQVWWGESLWRLGKYDTARTTLDHALAVAQVIDSTEIVGWVHHQLGIIDDIQGYYEAAHEHLRRACDAWRSLGNATTLSVSLNSLGLVCHHQGNLRQAREFMEHALRLCEQIDNRHLQALLFNNLSIVAIEQREYMQAQDYLQHGLDLAISSGNVTGQAEMYNNLGRNALLQGHYSRAAEYQEQALQISEQLGNRSTMATAMLNLAEANRELGDPQRAEALYRQGLQIAQHDKIHRTECNVLIGLAELLVDSDSGQARQLAAHAVTVAEKLGNPDLIERANAIARALGISAERTEKNMSA